MVYTVIEGIIHVPITVICTVVVWHFHDKIRFNKVIWYLIKFYSDNGYSNGV